MYKLPYTYNLEVYLIIDCILEYVVGVPLYEYYLRNFAYKVAKPEPSLNVSFVYNINKIPLM